MEAADLNKPQTQVVSLPPLISKPKKKGRKTSPPKAKGKPTPEKAPSPSPASRKESKLSKDVTGVHPSMIGIDMQALHPHHSELIDGLYKRPLVVSILMPKKRPKSFKYETSKRAALDIWSSEGEDSDGASSKRPRSPDRPSSQKSPTNGQKKKTLKAFLIKVYDLVESKEAIYPVVVREYDKLLEELIEEEKSFAVCDYFQPQSLEWWAKALRNVVIVFDKPNGEMCVAVDKKLIRRLVVQKMEHHEWMDKALTPEQAEIQHKMMIDKARKMGSRSAKKSALRSSADLSSSAELLPWNDFTKPGERNAAASFKGPSASAKSNGTGSVKSSGSSVRALPPVRSAKTARTRLFYVGDWVEGNFKRGGQWFPALIKKVHKTHEYYDVDYEDGRSETNVEAKLVRASAATSRSRQNLAEDSVDLLYGASEADTVQVGYHSETLPEDPSAYDYGDAFSPGATGELGESFEESGFDASASAESFVEQSYATEAQFGESSYDASVELDTSQPAGETVEGSAQESWAAEESQYDDRKTNEPQDPSEAADGTGHPRDANSEARGTGEGVHSGEEHPVYGDSGDAYVVDDSTGGRTGYSQDAYPMNGDSGDAYVVDDSTGGGTGRSQGVYPANGDSGDAYVVDDSTGGRTGCSQDAYPMNGDSGDAYLADGDDHGGVGHSHDAYYVDGEDHDHQAYDYTHQAVISEDAASAQADIVARPPSGEGGAAEEVADSAELIAMENSTVERKVATPYVEEIISGVLSTQYAVPEEHFPEPEGGTAGHDAAAEDDVWQTDVEGDARSAVAELPVETSDQNIVSSQPEFLTAEHLPAITQEQEESGALEVSDYVPSDALAESDNFENSAFSFADPEPEQESPVFKPTPSKIALASMLQSLALEDSSLESGARVRSKLPKAKKAPKSTKSGKGTAVSSKQGKGVTSSSILLGNSESETEDGALPRAKSTKSKNRGTAKSAPEIAVPDGLFKGRPNSRGRARTAGRGSQPPDIDRYVAAAAAVGRPEQARAATATRTRSTKSRSQKKKKKPAVSASVEQLPTTAKDLLKDVPALEDDANSIHSLHSMQSLHSSSSHPSHMHFTADAHGNFDHKNVPHYPLPHISRMEATKAALEAIHKPHSNPHDRYTYTMMPAPVHMLHVQHHHYGYGPLKDEHGNFISDSHAGSHAGSVNGDVSRSNSQDTELPGPHSAGYARALSPDSLREHNEHHAHKHHGKPLHFPHHEHDFIVTAVPPTQPHHHEPSIFSETVHSTHSHLHSTSRDVHSPGPGLPPIHTGSRSRVTTPNTAQVLLRNPADASVADSRMQQSVVSFDASADTKPITANRPNSRAKTASPSPFENKDRYKGPSRRVIDIIEWARISVGGSPKKQKRRISDVEKRLLKR
jgi:hypothetical protein